MSLSQIELVWVRVRVEWECFWVNLREDNKVSESNLAEFKIAAIIELNQNKWLKFFVQNGWILDGRIQDGRIQDGCHLQVNQIELIWFRVRVECECFWVNLREDNKVSESKMAVSESNMAEFKMAAIIKLSRNEWVKFYCSNGGNQSWEEWVSMRGKTKIAESKMAKFRMAEFKMAEFKMAASIKLSQNEWVQFYCSNGGNQSWEEWVSMRGKTKIAESKMAKFRMAEFKMAEFKMAAIIRLSENEWVWVRLN